MWGSTLDDSIFYNTVFAAFNVILLLLNLQLLLCKGCRIHWDNSAVGSGWCCAPGNCEHALSVLTTTNPLGILFLLLFYENSGNYWNESYWAPKCAKLSSLLDYSWGALSSNILGDIFSAECDWSSHCWTLPFWLGYCMSPCSQCYLSALDGI